MTIICCFGLWDNTPTYPESVFEPSCEQDADSDNVCFLRRYTSESSVSLNRSPGQPSSYRSDEELMTAYDRGAVVDGWVFVMRDVFPRRWSHWTHSNPVWWLFVVSVLWQPLRRPLSQAARCSEVGSCRHTGRGQLGFFVFSLTCNMINQWNSFTSLCTHVQYFQFQWLHFHDSFSQYVYILKWIEWNSEYIGGKPSHKESIAFSLLFSVCLSSRQPVYMDCERPASLTTLTDVFVFFFPCVSDPLAAGGWDCVGSASFVGHRLIHAAESDAAHCELQRATALSLWRRSAAVCVWAGAVDGEIQRGKNHPSAHTTRLVRQDEYWLVSAVHCLLCCE